MSGSERQKLSRRRVKERGICLYCRENKTSGKTICQECSNKRSIDRVNRTKSGICATLHCRKVAVSGVSCAECCERRKKTHQRLKAEVFAHYGTKCSCSCGCTVTNPRHLTIDHKNNDGAQQRREAGIRGGHANYRNIIKAGFPTDLQVLCWNCNCAKQFSGGCL